MFKESAGDKILRGGKKKRGRDPEDGCEGSEGAGKEKKRAHQELSLRGRRSERASKGKRGCEKAL